MTTTPTLTRSEAAAVLAVLLLGAAAAVGYGTIAGSDAGAATAARPATTQPRPTPTANGGRADEQPPSADEFGRRLVALTTAHATAHGDARRIRRTDCVQPVPGRYMCSYSVSEPGRSTACHLMQARWTPNAASTISVTLAGRTKRCGSLRDALASLG